MASRVHFVDPPTINTIREQNVVRENRNAGVKSITSIIDVPWKNSDPGRCAGCHDFYCWCCCEEEEGEAKYTKQGGR